MKDGRRNSILIFMVVILSFMFITGAILYPKLPDKIATHFNAYGEPDDYMNKFFGVFITPLVATGVALLLYFIPRIDPLKKNYRYFMKYYNGFIIVFMFILLIVHVHTLLYSMGVKINVNIIGVIVIFSILFYIGYILDKLKKNWFIGIRTPWTLSSDRVWEKTHKLGAKTFISIAFVSLLSIFFPRFTLFFILIPLIVGSVILVVYSYLEYQREEGKSNS